MFFDAGGGHRSAALALKAVVEQQERPWEIRLINLQELLDPLDIFRKYSGIRMQDIYNKMLKKGITLGSGPLLHIMHAIIRLYHNDMANALAEFWRQSKPDLVVTLIPNFNRAIFDGLRKADRAEGRPDTPMASIITDIADYPPHFWIEKQEQCFICGTRQSGGTGASPGHPGRNVFQDLRHDPAAEVLRTDPVLRETERERLGLDPNLPTGSGAIRR